MKKFVLIIAFVIASKVQFSQDIPQEYYALVKMADSLYNAMDFKNSAFKYAEAFKANNGKAFPNDRYNAACSWALSAQPDSAFFHLNKIATKAKYANYEHIKSDADLVSLYTDSRWNPLLDLVWQNKQKAEEKFNKPLIAALDSIYTQDQMYRQQLDSVRERYGWDSKELENHWRVIQNADSINLIRVKSILDQHGWLGPDVIDQKGNATLFLVIQHADQTTQEKYLPMMREAVKNGKARAGDLALLEDRVALGQGKRQIYGSQIGRNPDTQNYFISPLEDPDNVDKRRASVGLEPLAEYASNWGIVWDVEQYKKDLPKLEDSLKQNK